MKKANQYQQEKLRLAQYKKEYFRKIRLLLEAIGCADLYPLIPPNEKDKMFRLRLKGINVVPGNEGGIPKSLANLFGKSIKHTVKTKRLKVMDTDYEIDYLELETCGLALYGCFGDETNKKVYNEVNFYKHLQPFLHWFKNEARLYVLLDTEASIICRLFSNLSAGVFWFKIYNKKESKKVMSRITVQFNFRNTARKIVHIDNQPRTVFEVAWGNSDGEYQEAFFEPKLSECKKVIESPLKVYVQLHALIRLDERLGNALCATTHMDIFYTFEQKMPYIYTDGKFYFDFYLLGAYKVGYLVGEIIEDDLVIRTFLFLTNNGTPESKKLNELTGFTKVDKNYLGIDKLSVFQNSDIASNEQLVELFTKAGCGSLFDINVNLSPNQNYNSKLSKTILNYLDTSQETITTIEELESALEEEAVRLGV